METIKCQECDHVNEAQRVYCHNCGARLDRSALIEEARKPKKTEKARQSPHFAKAVKGFIWNLVKTTALAFIVAGLIQAGRPPVGIPPDQELGGAIVDAPSISVDLETAGTTPIRLVYTEPALDAYLDNRIKPDKDSATPGWLMRYDSSYVNLGNGSLRVTKVYRVFNLPIYVGGVFEAVLGGGTFNLKNLGGNIGHLPISGAFFSLVDTYLFGDFIKGLDEERKGLSKMKSIAISPAAVEIISG